MVVRLRPTSELVPVATAVGEAINRLTPNSDAAALRWQASELHADARVHVDAPATDHQTDRDVALALFRIFQETLTNVARHAKATEVWVSFAVSDDTFVLQIRDNGIGLGDEDLRRPDPHGIRDMRERAQQLGGDVSVSSQRGSGTTVVISVPRIPHAG